MRFKMFRVLRDGIRVEERDYYTWGEADTRAKALRKMLRDFDPKAVRTVSISTIYQKY